VSPSVVGVPLPRMAAVASTGDSAETRRLGLTALRVIALASATLAVTCAFAGGAFLELWVDADFADEAWGPLIALSLGFGVLATGAVGQALLDASGRAGLNAALTAAGAGVALALGLGLAAAFDSASGAAIGVATGLSIIGLLALELSRRTVLGLSRSVMFRVVGLPWLGLAAAGAVAYLASWVVAAPPLVTIGLVATAAALSVGLAGLRAEIQRGGVGS
jgi:O-antigen/teichoic acid export membrane protein